MLYSIVLVILLILDQGLKYWTTSTLELDVGIREVIPNLFSFMNVHNTGVAFGLFKDSPELFRWILVGVALIFSVVAGILIARRMVKGAFGRWTMLLMIAGALGNCIDRIINGFVVDMLRVDFFKYIFNLADVYLTVGGILFCLYVIFHKKPEEELYPEEDYENINKPKKRRKRGEDEDVYNDRAAAQQNAAPGGKRRPVRRQPAQQEYDLSHHTANIETIKMPKLSPAEVTSVLHPIPPSMYENRDNTLPRQPQMGRPDGQRPPQRQGTQPLPNMQNTQRQPGMQRPHGGTQPLPNMQNTQRQMRRPQEPQRPGSYSQPGYTQPGYAQPPKEEFSLEDIMAEFSDN